MRRAIECDRLSGAIMFCRFCASILESLHILLSSGAWRISEIHIRACAVAHRRRYSCAFRRSPLRRARLMAGSDIAKLFPSTELREAFLKARSGFARGDRSVLTLLYSLISDFELFESGNLCVRFEKRELRGAPPPSGKLFASFAEPNPFGVRSNYLAIGFRFETTRICPTKVGRTIGSNYRHDA